MIFGRAFLELFVVGTLAWVAGSEPVKSCLKEETFQRADCKTVREHVSNLYNVHASCNMKIRTKFYL